MLTLSHRGSLPPVDVQNVNQHSDEEVSDNESEEEDDNSDDQKFRPKKSTIIGFRTINSTNAGEFIFKGEWTAIDNSEESFK